MADSFDDFPVAQPAADPFARFPAAGTPAEQRESDRIKSRVEREADRVAAGMPAPAQQQPTAQPTQDAARFSFAGGNDLAATPAATRQPADAQPEPDAPTWLERRYQDIRGKRDPRYADLPEFVNTPGAMWMPGTLTGAGLMGVDDSGYADIVERGLGDSFISRTKDANGYPIITYRGADDKPISAYINKPGLGPEDVFRMIEQSLPYIATGGPVGAGLRAIGAPLLLRMIGSGATAGATSLAADMAANSAGSKTPINPEKAMLTSLFGLAGEPMAIAGSALWRKFVTTPSLYDAATGQLTAKGAELAKNAGVDPTVLTAKAKEEFAKVYAMTGDASRAAVQSETAPMGVPVTKGQLTKDKEQLAFEEGARRKLWGQHAQDVILAHDAAQAQAVARAARSTRATDSGKQSMYPPNAPETNLSSGQSIIDTAKSAFNAAKAKESAAWAKPTEMYATQDAFDMMPGIIQARMGGEVPIKDLHKYSYRMAQMLDDFRSGAAPEGGSETLGSGQVATITNMQRRLGQMVSDASSDPGDNRLARQIYRGFTDWVDAASDSALLSGDAAAAANWKAGRDVTRTLKDVFEPRERGKLTPAAKFVQSILDAPDGTAENVVTKIFGATPGGVAKDSTVPGLKALKNAYDTYLPPEDASKAWEAIKSTYLMRLLKAKKGENASHIDTYQNMLNNIDNAFANQRGMVNLLLSPTETNALRQFRAMLKVVTYKDPNPSGTAYTGAGFAQKALQTAFKALGGDTLIGQMLVQSAKPLWNIYGAARVRDAVSPMIKPTLPSAAIPGAAAGLLRPRSDQ